MFRLSFIILLLVHPLAWSQTSDLRVLVVDEAQAPRLLAAAEAAATQLREFVDHWADANDSLFRVADTGGARPAVAVKATVITKVWLAHHDVPADLRDILEYDAEQRTALVVYPKNPFRDCRLVFVLADAADPSVAERIAAAADDFKIAIIDAMTVEAAGEYMYERYRQIRATAPGAVESGATPAEAHCLFTAFDGVRKKFGPQRAIAALPWNGNRHFTQVTWTPADRTAFDLELR